MIPQNGGPAPAGSQAVVIGASLAGLLAARVLADRFDQVTLVDRDRLPDGAEPRKGLPQARHLHILLVRGQQLLEGLFPGILEELQAAGAAFLDAGEDFPWLGPAGWGVRFRAGLKLLCCSRDLLDWVVRRRVMGLERLQVCAESEVVDLIAAPGNRAVGGVVLRDRRHGMSARLAADLVVDASGRNSKAGGWLVGLGYPVAEQTVVDAHLGYATRIYRRAESRGDDWRGAYVQAAPPSRVRGAVLLPIEGQRWMLTIAGGSSDYPPIAEAGFDDFVRSLASPVIQTMLRQAEPLSAIAGYRGTENRWRHYERLPRWPDGFVVLGDAACCFNPVYGQGMTLAALGATALGELLDRHRGESGLAQRFQQELARISRGPWQLATGQDRRFPGVEGVQPSTWSHLIEGYLDRLTGLATHDPALRRQFLEVLHLVQPMSVLFRPALVARVLLSPRRERGPAPAMPVWPPLAEGR